MKTCYVMRGIPGSGKSTWLHKNVCTQDAKTTCTIFSADDWHINEATGKYNFDPKEAKNAHEWCLRNFILACTESKNFMRENHNSPIAVSNTNVKIWELVPYVRIAEAFGYEVKIIRMVCNPFTAFNRNVHMVPLETIWRMQYEFENLPSIWKETPVRSDEVTLDDPL